MLTLRIKRTWRKLQTGLQLRPLLSKNIWKFRKFRPKRKKVSNNLNQKKRKMSILNPHIIILPEETDIILKTLKLYPKSRRLEKLFRLNQKKKWLHSLMKNLVFQLSKISIILTTIRYFYFLFRIGADIVAVDTQATSLKDLGDQRLFVLYITSAGSRIKLLISRNSKNVLKTQSIL